MHKRFKITLIIVLSTIATVLIAGYLYLSTQDYSRFKALIETAVTDATGRKLTIAGDFTLSISLNPQLVMRDATLANVSWGSKPTMLTIGKLNVGVKLLPLIVGDVEFTDLQLIDTDLLLETDANGQGNWHFTAPDSSHPDPSNKGLGIKRLGVDQLNLKHFAVTFLDGKTHSTEHFTIDTLDVLHSSRAESLTLALTGNVNGQPAVLSGQTGSQLVGAGFPVNLTGEVAGIKLKLQGEVDNLLLAQDINLAIQASGTNLATVGTGIDMVLPKTDSFSLMAQVSGHGDAVTMSNAHGIIGYSSVVLEIAGDIGNLNALEDMHFELTGSGNNLSELQAIAGSTQLPETGPFTVSGTLSGAAKALSLSDAQADIGHQSVKLSLSGKVNDVIALTGIDVNLKGSGNNLSELQAIAGNTKLPETGPFTVSGTLSGAGKALSLSDAQADITHQSVKLSLSGKVNDVIALTGIDVNLKGSGNNLSELQAIAGNTKLPETGPFTVSGTLSGAGKALSLSDAQADIGHQSVKLSLSGKVNDVVALTGIDVNLKGSGNNLSELQAIAGNTKLPETGPFTVSGTLSGAGKALSLSDAQADIGHQSVKLSLSGKVNDVVALTGIDVNLKGSGNNLSELQAIAGNTKLPETGPFTASARLNGTAKTLALRDAHTVITQKNSQLKISGKITNLQRLSGLDLSFKGSGKDFTELGPTFGTQLPDLGPFKIIGKLAGSRDVLDLRDMYAQIDQSDFSAEGQLTLGERPKIHMQIESGLLDLTRLMGEVKKESTQDISKAHDPQATAFLNKPLPFNLLDAVDAHIKLNARHIKARDAAFELGKLALDLDSGEMRVNTLEATYKKTKLSANLNVKTQTPPLVATKFLVQDFDLGSFLKEIHNTQEVDGHVDFAADLHSQGDSPHSLLAALDGTIGAVIGKGRLPRMLDLLAEDLTSKVIPFWGQHKNAGNLNCGVIEFSITQGTATSKTFLIDSQLGHFKAEGDFNLGTEQINFLLIPKPKEATLISLSTKLRITGNFNHPKVRPAKGALLEKAIKEPFTFALGAVETLLPFEKLNAHKMHPCDLQKLESTVNAIYN